MKTYIFTDLDDTLFQTERKLAAKQKNKETYTQISTDPSIKAIFQTEHQSIFYEILCQTAEVVAVTGRDLKHFIGLNLPHTHTAVLNHGASLAYCHNRQWQLDRKWHQDMLEHSQRYTPILQELLAHLATPYTRSSIIEQDGLAICTVSKVQKGTKESVLTELANTIQQHFNLSELGFYMHLNGNNLSFIPLEVKKARAVTHLIQLHQPKLTLGLGDSYSDLEFMRLCDYWVTPSQSQICKQL